MLRALGLLGTPGFLGLPKLAVGILERRLRLDPPSPQRFRERQRFPELGGGSLDFLFKPLQLLFPTQNRAGTRGSPSALVDARAPDVLPVARHEMQPELAMLVQELQPDLDRIYDHHPREKEGGKRHESRLEPDVLEQQSVNAGRPEHLFRNFGRAGPGEPVQRDECRAASSARFEGLERLERRVRALRDDELDRLAEGGFERCKPVSRGVQHVADCSQDPCSARGPGQERPDAFVVSLVAVLELAERRATRFERGEVLTRPLFGLVVEADLLLDLGDRAGFTLDAGARPLDLRDRGIRRAADRRERIGELLLLPLHSGGLRQELPFLLGQLRLLRGPVLGGALLLHTRLEQIQRELLPLPQRLAPFLELREHFPNRRFQPTERAFFLGLGRSEPRPLLFESLFRPAQLFEARAETDPLRARVLQLLEQPRASLPEHGDLIQKRGSARLTFVQLFLRETHLGLALQELELELLQLRLMPREDAGDGAPAVFGLAPLLLKRAPGTREALQVLLGESQIQRLDLLAQTIEPPGLPHLPRKRPDLAFDLRDHVVHARQVREGQVQLLERLLLSGLVAHDSRRLFEQEPPVAALVRQDVVDHPALDEGIRVGAHPGVEKEVAKVTETAGLSIDEILALSVTEGAA